MDYQNDNYSRETKLVLPNIVDQVTAKNFMANVFAYMFVALGISAIVAFLVTSNHQYVMVNFMQDATGKVSLLAYVIMFAPLGFVLLMSFGFARLSAPALMALFLVYSAINGVSFGIILPLYTTGSVLGCFLSASAMFGIMAFMGYTTSKDLTSFGRILFMGLIGIIIASVINFFLRSGTMDYVISFIGVMIFTGLTAYDVQKLKRIGEGIEMEGAPAVEVKKRSIFGALSLYLDFINLFLFLLRLFGRRN